MLEEDEDMPNLFGNGDDESSDDEITLKYDTYTVGASSRALQLPRTLRLALLNQHHSLWAEYIYNAARLLADLMTLDGTEGLPAITIDSSDKCLELGAGAGLPSIIASLCGAKAVVVSDYGNDLDLNLIYPLDTNVNYLKTLTQEAGQPTPTIFAVAYTWGNPVHTLIHPDQSYQRSDASIVLSSYDEYRESKLKARFPPETVAPFTKDDKFDKIFLADLIFNRSEHSKLLWTVQQCLKPDSGVCYVSFSHHDPGKAQLDLNFFTLAERDFGFNVKCLGKVIRQTYPFREQDGLDVQRGDVHLYTLMLPHA